MPSAAMKKQDVLLLTPLAAATVALFWIVPALPFAHLDDPSHWGVLGYAFTLVLILRLRWRGIQGSRIEWNWLLLFLAGMPVIYLANWLRFGGDAAWLWIELGGALLYWMLVLLALVRSPWFLVVGIAAHGLWDAWHYDLTDFVPNWYVLGCFIIDVTLGIYAAGQVTYWKNRAHRSRPPDPSTVTP